MFEMDALVQMWKDICDNMLKNHKQIDLNKLSRKEKIIFLSLQVELKINEEFLHLVLTLLGEYIHERAKVLKTQNAQLN